MSNIYVWVSGLILAFCLSMPATAAAPSQGVLEVRVKDHREAIGDFAQLRVTVGEISISPKPGLKFWQSGWKSLGVVPETVDLTKYIGKSSARIFRDSLNAGAFDAIHLKLKEVSGILKKNRRAAPVKNTVGPIKFPFEIHAQGETLIVLDLVVMDMSDHPPRSYELSVRGYEVYANGNLVDKVPPGP
jgi:hypothetical protein